MDVLSDLTTACRAADTETVTTRHNAIEKISRQLANSSVIRALDNNTDKARRDGSRGTFTWSMVFKVACGVVLKEGDTIRKYKEAPTKSTVTSREKKRVGVNEFIRRVVQTADKRGPRLKIADVMHHILGVLRDDLMCQNFGADHSSILLKFILPVRKYWVSISQDIWRELLERHVEFLKDPPPHYERVLLARVIYAVVQGGVQQCDFRGKNLLPMLEEYFTGIRNERNMPVLENMMGTLNTVCWSLAVNGRVQVCRIGENISTMLIGLMVNKPSETLKDHVVEFLRLQISVHHPRGTLSEQDGAFAVNWELWKSILRKIYDATYNDLQELGGRNKFAKGASIVFRGISNVRLKENFIELAADACHQVFATHSTSLDVTQYSFETQAPGSAAKRRRVESGWGALRDIISSTGQVPAVIPWLQLLHRIVEKYPSSVPVEEFTVLASTLHVIQADCRNIDVLNYVLPCLRVLAVSQSCRRPDIDDGTWLNSSTVWEKIWAAALRSLSLHHAEEEGFALLSCLLEYHLVEPSNDVWTLFLPGITVSSSTAPVNFLATYLRHLDLPETYCPSVLNVLNKAKEHRNFPLRCQLLNWLVPNSQEVEDSWRVLSNRDATVMAEVLVALTVRDTRSINLPSQHAASRTDQWTELADTYLQTSFDIPLGGTMTAAAAVESRTMAHASCLTDVQKELNTLLKRETENLLESTETDLVMAEHLASWCNLILKLVHGSLHHDVLKSDGIMHDPLVEMLKALMKRLASLFTDLVRKEAAPSLVTLMRLLDDLCTVPHSQHSHQMAEVCRSISADKLLYQLLLISREKVPSLLSKSSSTQSRPSLTQATSHVSDFDLNLDDDMSMESTSTIPLDERMDVDDDNDAAASSADARGVISLMCPKALNDGQRLRLRAVSILCHWCNYCHGSGDFPHGASEYDVKRIKKEVLGLLEDESWDESRAADIQLLITIVKGLQWPEQNLEVEEIGYLLDAFRSLCRAHRRDQEVCENVLHLLAMVVPHLSDPPDGRMVSEGMQDMRNDAVQLLCIFWDLALKHQYVGRVRKTVAECMQIFIKHDQQGLWTKWQLKGDDNGNDRALADEFPKLLKDKDQQIRLLAAKDISILFEKKSTDGKVVACNKLDQEAVFDSVHSILKEAMTISGRYGHDESKDAIINRTASMLHTLAAIATISPVCEKRALFGICQMAKDHSLETSGILKILDQLSSRLGYSSLKDYMSSHMPFLVQAWLREGYTITEFAFQLVGYASLADFYSENLHVVVPFLVMRKNMMLVEGVARTLSVEMIPMLTACLPHIMIHILPWFAVSKSETHAGGPNVQQKITRANACYELITNTIPHEEIEQSIRRHLADIVVNILKALHDEGSGGGDVSRFSDPEPNPPYYDRDTITLTLDYLTHGHGPNIKSLVMLLSKIPDGIQQVLLALRTHLSNQHRVHEELRALLMYRLFVGLILREFASQLGGCWAFVLRDVIFTLIHTINSVHQRPRSKQGSQETNLLVMCVELLQDMCKTAVDICPQELERFLSTIIGAVVPLIGNSGSVSIQCSRLLDFLVVENAAKLESAIRLLDPLPKTPPSAFAKAHAVIQQAKYQGQSYTLIQEVSHFLAAASQYSGTTGSSRLYGLQFLCTQLATKKDELADITASHVANGGGEDDLLVQLIQELLHLAKSTNKEVALEASRCLGEIGPVDLAVIAIKPLQQIPALAAALESCGDLAGTDLSSYKRNCHIFHLLNEYLLDPSVEVVTAASAVVKKMLSTHTGYQFASKYKELVQDHLLQYIHTFRTSKNKLIHLEEKSCSVEEFVGSVGDVQLWAPVAHSSHDQWIKQLTCAFINCGVVKDEVLRLITPVCNTKTEFCEVVLPYLIHDVLVNTASVPDYRVILSERIHHFFDMHCGLNEELASRPTTPIVEKSDGSVCTNLASVKVMLSIVQYLRLQERPVASRGQQGASQTAWNNNFWLDLDYLQIAKAAQNCSAHFTTLLYAEIWCDVQRATSVNASQSLRRSASSQSSVASVEEEFSQRSQLDKLSTLSGSTDIKVQSLMLEAYRNLGDPDGVYGCGAGQLADSQARTRTYEHENNWGKALSSYDLEMSEPATSSVQVGLLQALQKFGVSHVLDTYLQGLNQQGLDRVQEIQEFQYKLALSNANWDLDVPSRFDDDCGYNKAVYSALWGIKERDSPMATLALSHARKHALGMIVQSSQESVRSLYPVLSNLVCLTQIDDLAGIILRNEGRLTLDQMSEKWGTQDKLMSNDFDLVEPVLEQRSLLMGLASRRVGDNSQLIMRLEELARSARLAGRHQVAERAIHSLHQLDVSSSSLSWRLEEAHLFWNRKEQNVAKNLMKELVCNLRKLQEERPQLSQLYAQCLGIYGSWLAKTHSENPSIVIDDYLRKAVDLLDSINCGESDVALDAFLSLARFADLQYQNIVDYMKSSTFEEKQALARRAKEDAEELRGLGEKSSRYLRILEKQCAIDEEELAAVEEDKTQYLECAIMHYLRCLAGGDKHDLRVFRLTSLWYENALVNTAINKHIRDSLPRIKSYKFLPLMYQLAARMSTSPSHKDDLFQPTLIQLIERVVMDHPHHTIHIILALANAYKDDEILQKPKATTSRGRLSKGNTQDSQQEEDRVQAAKAMVARLKRSKRAQIIIDTEKLCVAYIQLANWNVDQYKRETKAIPLPNNQPIKQMKNLKNVAMPTAEIRVDPSCRYDDIVYVEGFGPTFKLAGGINLPKIITCVGSDGVHRRQLVKGKDDLRQDAVMQQVFQMVNNLLKKDTEARQRQLTVRTYKVIPLSQRSGLLEWCEGTIPLGDYLIGQRGAHVRYRPRDIKANECRAELAAAHDRKSTSSKYQTFMRVCQRFQPVFRHFFMEKFPDPAHWYERRLAYTRSVATNSIVGYILGLGDRHVQNILIDCKTAEFIHIDLGVAFEQGRILPTPETVPFRLTRDIVDGMGVTGVEGVFRRCSEKTMEVMHGSQEALLTILQVLLYDPLYAWTISPLKAYALQQRRDARAAADPNCTDANVSHADIFDMERTPSSSNREPVENVNKVAERVLLRLQQKLRGVELGVQLSVSGQVNHLIQEARDPKNLCRLFPGWQPYI